MVVQGFPLGWIVSFLALYHLGMAPGILDLKGFSKPLHFHDFVGGFNVKQTVKCITKIVGFRSLELSTHVKWFPQNSLQFWRVFGEKKRTALKGTTNCLRIPQGSCISLCCCGARYERFGAILTNIDLDPRKPASRAMEPASWMETKHLKGWTGTDSKFLEFQSPQEGRYQISNYTGNSGAFCIFIFSNFDPPQYRPKQT